MTESPSSLLERAAAKLAELAADRHLAPPPWVADGSEVYAKSGPLVLGVPWDNDGVPDPDATWIATMSPSVAPPLVEWLRQAALAYELDNDSTQDEHALTFARAVLGEPENTP